VEARVGLPAVSGGNGRSVSDAAAPVYADWYEVVFKEHASVPAAYFFGKAEAGKKYLSIAVKPNKSYDILLLAGAKGDHVLLATGLVNNAAGNGYEPDGPGYTIEAGKSNIVSLTMRKTNITPDAVGGAAPDITFSGVDAGNQPLAFTYERDDQSRVALVTVPDGAVTFVMQLATTKLVDLARAGYPGGLLFAANKATLRERYPAGLGLILGQAKGVPEDARYAYAFTIEEVIKVENIDGLAYVDLEYYAFGDTNSGSSLWHVRNGLNHDEDTNGAGGAIAARFGTGSGE
jgi:hypothetical protein